VKKNEFTINRKKRLNTGLHRTRYFKKVFLMAIMLVFWIAMANREAMLQVTLTFLLAGTQGCIWQSM
jgi:uncharacterized membrane protein YqjE